MSFFYNAKLQKKKLWKQANLQIELRIVNKNVLMYSHICINYFICSIALFIQNINIEYKCLKVT